MQFMTTEWAEAYMLAWNNDAVITKKLKSFSSAFKYSISDRNDITPMVIKVEKGLCVAYGREEDFNKREIEYEISSKAQNWQKVFDKNVNIDEVWKIKGFDFRGPKLKALANKGGLERGVELMNQMSDVTIPSL